MAVSRGDLEIGDDRTTTGKSPPIATDRESRSSQDSSVVECDKPKGKIVNTNENNVGTGRLVVDEIQGRDSAANETSTNKSFPPVRDKTSKNSQETAKSELVADKTKRTFHAGIKEAKSFRKDDAYECSTVGEERVSVDFGPVRIKRAKRVKTRRRKGESKEGSISAKVIYKLVGTAANNNNNKKQRLEHSSQNHANLIVVDATIPSCATSRGPRELAADSCVDLGWPTTKTGRSSNVDEEHGVGQRTRNCENCGGPRRKCCGECEGSAQEEERGANGRELGRKHERLASGSLCRSRSLPRLSVHDSGVACSGNEQSPAAGHPHNSKQQLAADLRQLHTLKQHYYPEGGWGWVVLFAGMLVQMLSHGVHGSSGILLRQVADKFGQRVYLETG